MTSSRKDCRSGEKRCAPVTSAEALYCQGGHAEMTRSQLSEAMGVNPSTLANWLDPEHDSRIPDDRRDHVLRLTDDNSAYVRYVAHLQGLVVYDPREVRGKNVTRMVSEFGDLLKALDESRADGAVTPDEARRIQREGGELIAAVDVEIHQALLAAGLETEAP